ncbi:MAG: gamma-glutamyl-gamma-aminobutyrate hydrolase family protein [Pseudomonadota bacterium]|nr:gamma-glutamyl-gamma-aminobutyrate hydrolase family protein [Pseudomonadota bacterium]
MLPTVAIIDPAVKKPALTAFNDLVSISPLPLTYHLPFVHGLTSLLQLDPQQIKGAVLLGSNLSVHDHSFQRDMLVSWLRKFIEEHKRPVLGICYGHQLFAHMYGCKIGLCNPDGNRKFGLRKVKLVADKYLRMKAREQEIVVSHTETVVEMSDEFEVFASSDEIPYDGLRHRQHLIWTLQSHPEATQTFVYNNAMQFELDPEIKDSCYGILRHFLVFAAAAQERVLKKKLARPQ